MRFVALGFGVLVLYYVRFFLAVRQEGSTLVQIGILLAAAAVLVVPVHFWSPAGTGWFRWATALVALGLAVGVFVWADHDAHSVSDTLNRAVPTLCLIAAVGLRMALQTDARRRTAPSD